MEQSAHKLLLLQRIAELERQGLWHLDVEDDPETYPLMPDKVDYLNERLLNRLLSPLANRAGERFFEGLVRKGQLVLREVRGLENFTAVKGGRLITCNHFSVGDNYAVWRAIRESMEGRPLYKVIREGNYTNPPKPFGFMMRHCNTLPLSSQPATMRKFNRAVRTLLQRGETILMYPEQGMWWNYRKPRPMQEGVFSLAVMNQVPILPFFITMEDTDTIDGDGFPVQAFTVHILPPLYPDPSLPLPDRKAKLQQENYEAWVRIYESFYGIPLVYSQEV